MKARTNSRILTLGAITGLALSCWPAGAYADTCETNPAGTKRVCASWDEGPDPLIPDDFDVDYGCGGCSDAPTIDLKTAATTWTVWSEVIIGGAPANIGSLELDNSGANDFEVTIANGAGAGAANLGRIYLDDASFTGYSSIEGGSISGNLSGGLTAGLVLVQDSAGNGGELTFTIGGDVSRAITVPVVNTLTITGDLTANLTVSDKVTTLLDIGGDVGASVTISIASLWSADVEIGSASSQFEGELDLQDGVPLGSTVKILSDIGSATSTPQIDLNNKIVSGWLECLGDNEGNIINGKEVKNLVTLASGSGNSFSGTATFLAVRGTGTINTTSSATMNGVVRITAGSAGTISTSGSVGSSGKIWIEANLALNGEILIGGDLRGDVDIDGALAGDVLVDEDLSGSGRILVDGLCSGTIGIGKKTTTLTLIHLLSGLDTGGTIEINQGDASVNAQGTIHVGPSGLIMPDIIFDGCIRIYADAQGLGGGLEGSIFVQGCHATSDPLNICIDGPVTGTVTINDTGCVPLVHGWSCGGCP